MATRLKFEENTRRNEHEGLLQRLALREKIGKQLLEIANRESALAATLKEMIAPIAAFEIISARPAIKLLEEAIL